MKITKITDSIRFHLRYAAITRYLSRLLLLIALVHVTLIVVGYFTGHPSDSNSALWVLTYTVGSVALNSQARIDDLEDELKERAAHAEKLIAVAHERLDAQGSALSATISEVGMLRFKKAGQ